MKLWIGRGKHRFRFFYPNLHSSFGNTTCIIRNPQGRVFTLESSDMNQIINLIKTLANTIPLDVFAFIGSILEEIIAPIPSPLVMTTAGTLAHTQNYTLLYLFWLAVVASLGKTISSWLYYVLADKTEDFVLTRFGKILGFSHKEVENIGRHFNGARKDDVILLVVRALPIMPTSLVSVVCGFIKLNIRTYLQSTFIGYFIRSFIFLYLGYTGIAAYGNVSANIVNIESIAKLSIAVVIVLLLGWVLYKRDKGKIHNWLKRITSKLTDK